MRNDRNKLRRLIRFLNNKDQRQKFAKLMGTTGDDDEPGEIGKSSKQLLHSVVGGHGVLYT